MSTSTCNFQLFSFAYKTNATSIKTTLGGSHRHRHRSFCTGFIQFPAFLEISHLDAFQGGSIEAPSLSFMPCAKAYKKHICCLHMCSLRGMQNLEIIEITQKSKDFSHAATGSQYGFSAVKTSIAYSL